MADPVSVVGSTIESVTAAIELQKKATRSLFALHENSNELKSFELDVQVSSEKFRLWRDRWSGEEQTPSVSSQALWGVQGWENVRGMLTNIDKICREIEEILTKHSTDSSIHPKFKWKLALIKLKRRDTDYVKKLRNLASSLNLAVDAIWIYAETVFDSLHGVLAHGMPLPSRERLLKQAIQSRTGSIKLHDICRKSSVNCSLGLDLGGAEGSITSPILDREDSPFHLQYELFASEHDGSRHLMKMTVDNVQGFHSIPITKDASVDTTAMQLFKLDTTARGITIPVAPQGSVPQSLLQIDETTPEDVLLKAQPESLQKVLQTLKAIDNISNHEHLSIGAKVELACQVVESGFFLLGTPWFSSLSTRNMLRLKTADRNQRHTFVLEIQTIGLDDLLFDDSEALAETSQLYLLGVLLMEIALGCPESANKEKDYGEDQSIMSRLPLVEQNMGAQYCKATAFCLQHRRPRFEYPEKYEGIRFKDWEVYLAEFLQDYYWQVYLRLGELRSIDTTSEFRSRKSWLTG